MAAGNTTVTPSCAFWSGVYCKQANDLAWKNIRQSNWRISSAWTSDELGGPRSCEEDGTARRWRFAFGWQVLRSGFFRVKVRLKHLDHAS